MTRMMRPTTSTLAYDQKRIDGLVIPEAKRDTLYQMSATRHGIEDYNPSLYLWSHDKPTDGVCSECCSWRRYPLGQRHFGYAWWGTCDRRICQHSHHQTETGIA